MAELRAAARRRRRRRPRRAAARLGERSRRRRRAGRTGARPVIVTCRPQWEGGALPGLRRRAASGFSPTRWRSAPSTSTSNGARASTISSRRPAAGASCSRRTTSRRVPIDLASARAAMRSTGAEVDQARGEADAPERLRCRCSISARERPTAATLVLIGMGEYGLATRVLAGRFGSRVDLRRRAQRDRPDDARPRSLDDYRFRSIAEATAVYGVVGQPVSHSVSPAMHNAAFARRAHRRGLSAAAGGRRRRLRHASAARSASAAPASRFRSKCRCSIGSTRSYSVARRIGAINTIRVEDGRWIGGNTDATGFLEPLQRSRAARAACARRCSAPAARRARSPSRSRRAAAQVTAARAQSRAGERGRDADVVGSGRAVAAARPAAGICWSTARRSACIPHVDETPLAASRS